MRATHQLAGSPDASKYNQSEGCTEIFASSVYRDLKTGTLINCGLIPEIRNTMFRYDEKLPEMNWELTGETEVIASYECQKAVTEYAGRKWTVWFSPEVPVDCGLWKFNGLPGLIMRAADSKEEYVFTLTSIEHKQEDITRYPEREKVVSRKEYRKAEKNSHDDPILVSKGAEGYLIIMSRSRNLTGKEIFTSGHFIYPYNPIEKKIIRSMCNSDTITRLIHHCIAEHSICRDCSTISQIYHKHPMPNSISDGNYQYNLEYSIVLR
jgi:hypothetical protein